jgi:3-deoxy-manno-octulosonate cytidylyltransferase (CMP-KDO synthetase)
MKILGIIPSRYASTRFPGKPLADINGKSMVQRVYEQATKAKSLAKVIVATDDQRIFDHVKSWGGEVAMTSSNHPSGTDRCKEVLESQKEEFDIVVNIQGDEPFIDPSQIENVTQSFINKETQIASLAKKITSLEELFNPNSVKVVIAENKKALYFSRAAIPFLRGVEEKDYLSFGEFYKHIGLYAYRAEVLKVITNLPPSRIEKAESLEQLRWLEAGYNIGMEITELEGLSVDTPEDLLQFTNKA